jgi:hypothetical protein
MASKLLINCRCFVGLKTSLFSYLFVLQFSLKSGLDNPDNFTQRRRSFVHKSLKNNQLLFILYFSLKSGFDNPGNLTQLSYSLEVPQNIIEKKILITETSMNEIIYFHIYALV